MIIRIDSLERGERETKTGKTQVGITVSGIKYKDGVEEGDYKKFFTDQFDSDIISSLEKIGVGNRAEIKMEKNGQFWNPVSASPVGKQTPSKDSQRDQKPKAGDEPSKVSTEVYTPSYSSIKMVALEHAVDVVRSAVSLNAQDKMSLFPKGKVTLDLLAQEVLGVADMFEKYLQGKVEGIPTADAAAVKNQGASNKPAAVIPDEDIPF